MATLNQEDLDRLNRPIEAAPKTWLWPNTPRQGNHQNIIKMRVGARDDASFDPRSRWRKVAKAVRKAGGTRQSISILDIGCGDAVLLRSLKRKFPKVQAIGLDPLIGDFDTHSSAEAAGVVLVRNWIQSLVETTMTNKIDLVLIMNSYRSWESAQLPDSEKDLPEKLDKWLSENSNYTVVTVSDSVRRKIKKNSKFYRYLGKGEDDSKMILTRF